MASNDHDEERPVAEPLLPGDPEMSPGDVPQGASTSSGATQPFSELQALRQDVAAIRNLIETRLSSDKTKDEAFDRLYEDLDRTKRHASVLDNKPLYIDLILFYDRMSVACEHAEHAAGEPRDVLLSLREELKEILLRRSLHPISTGNDFFEPRFQRAVSTEVCMSQDEDGKVLRILREGFSCGDLVIRPQEVVIARFRPLTAGERPRSKSTK